MSPILLIVGLVVLAVVGFFIVLRIPKGGAHRRKKQKASTSSSTSSAPEEEPGGDWFAASSMGNIPGLDFLVRAAREGGPESVSMVAVFDHMVEGAARTQALESADRLAQRMFESGASPQDVVKSIEAAAGSAKRQQRHSRVTRKWGPYYNPFEVEE
jgi:hypothetical protein